MQEARLQRAQLVGDGPRGEAPHDGGGALAPPHRDSEAPELVRFHRTLDGGDALHEEPVSAMAVREARRQRVEARARYAAAAVQERARVQHAPLLLRSHALRPPQPRRVARARFAAVHQREHRFFHALLVRSVETLLRLARFLSAANAPKAAERARARAASARVLQPPQRALQAARKSDPPSEALKRAALAAHIRGARDGDNRSLARRGDRAVHLQDVPRAAHPTEGNCEQALTNAATRQSLRLQPQLCRLVVVQAPRAVEIDL